MISKAEQIANNQAYLLGYYRGVLEVIATGRTADPKRVATEALLVRGPYEVAELTD